MCAPREMTKPSLGKVKGPGRPVSETLLTEAGSSYADPETFDEIAVESGRIT